MPRKNAPVPSTPVENKPVEPHPAVLVPRRWLTALIVLLTVPWLIAITLYLWPMRARTEASSSAPPASRAQAKGPWGELVSRPITISPPLEQVPRDWGPMQPAEWRFPEASPQQVEKFLANSGMAREHINRLMAATHLDGRINGLVMRPDSDILQELNPEVRARVYSLLSKTPANPRHHEAFRFSGSAAEWLDRGAASPATVEFIKPLLYSENGFQFLADVELVKAHITDGDELHRLAKTLHRVSTMIVELHISDSSQIDSIAEYWGRGGRRTDIRPLIESLAQGQGRQSIDISHLLPPAARLNLYRYPKITLADLSKSSLVNCLWTALNFFSSQPDDRLANMDAAVNRLRNDYFLVHDMFQLGDIIVLSDARGEMFHAAVFLADDLVFTKNGTSPFSPWIIMPLERLKGYYVQYGSDFQATYHRRKDL